MADRDSRIAKHPTAGDPSGRHPGAGGGTEANVTSGLVQAILPPQGLQTAQRLKDRQPDSDTHFLFPKPPNGAGYVRWVAIAPPVGMSCFPERTANARRRCTISGRELLLIIAPTPALCKCPAGGDHQRSGTVMSDMTVRQGDRRGDLRLRTPARRAMRRATVRRARAVGTPATDYSRAGASYPPLQRDQ